MLFPCWSGNIINSLTTVHLNPPSLSLQITGCFKGWIYFLYVAQIHKEFQSGDSWFVWVSALWIHSPASSLQQSQCLQPSCHTLTTETINLITENLLTVLHFAQPYLGSASLTQALWTGAKPKQGEGNPSFYSQQSTLSQEGLLQGHRQLLEKWGVQLLTRTAWTRNERESFQHIFYVRYDQNHWTMGKFTILCRTWKIWSGNNRGIRFCDICRHQI